MLPPGDHNPAGQAVQFGPPKPAAHSVHAAADAAVVVLVVVPFGQSWHGGARLVGELAPAENRPKPHSGQPLLPVPGGHAPWTAGRGGRGGCAEAMWRRWGQQQVSTHCTAATSCGRAVRSQQGGWTDGHQPGVG